MKSNFIDEKIKMELCDSCCMIEASGELKEKIDHQIKQQSQKENNRMKRINNKKVVIVAFAACLFVSANVFAAGKIQSLVSSSSKFDEVKDYSKMAQEEKKLGYQVKTLECFDNGYLFRDMSVDDVKGLDEAGNKVASYKDLDITYKNGDKDLCLSISKPLPSDEERTPTETRMVGDITLIYNLDTYKNVPEDYQMTEEDTANEANDHYYVSSGSEEVSIQMVSSLSWDDGDVHYLLQQVDSEMTVDELVDMAAQIIESK